MGALKGAETSDLEPDVLVLQRDDLADGERQVAGVTQGYNAWQTDRRDRKAGGRRWDNARTEKQGTDANVGRGAHFARGAIRFLHLALLDTRKFEKHQGEDRRVDQSVADAAPHTHVF